MLENEAKGSYGAFSSIGRITAETFINIKRKDIILNPKKNTGNKQIIIDFLKRNKYTNIDGDIKEEEIKDPNENNLDDSEIQDMEEESDIFALNKEEEAKKKEMLRKKKEMANRDPFTCFHRTNEDAYKFHDLHINKKKEKIIYNTPNCTKYFPNKNLVWHRMPTSPKWETMESRKSNINKINDGNYLGHEDPLKNITKVFINMDKQTMRGEITNNNVRINTARPFVSKNRENKSMTNYNRISDYPSSYRDNKTRIKSGKDINKKINLEMNSKWKNNNNIDMNQMTTTPLQTISTLENQKEEKSSKLIQKNNVTTQLTETPNNINTIRSDKSNIQYEEQNNIDLSDKEELLSNKSDLESSESNDSYHKFKNLYTKQIKSHQKKENLQKLASEKSRRSSINVSNQSISVKSKSKSKTIDKSHKRPKTSRVRNIEHKAHIKGPEFDKIIPREYYDNLADNGLTLIPFSINNYTLVRERPLSVVVYKRKPIFKKNRQQFKGMEIEQYINPQSYQYLNNKCYVPIFSKMKTRPSDDGTPLPTFMKGVVSRDAYNMTTDMSLKMNYFADGKCRGNYNTFLQKKSYNKIINLHLMNSKAFIDYLLINKKKAFENSDNIIKSLKFYNKNFKDLLKETSVSKFDNVTYKTIKNQYDNLI